MVNHSASDNYIPYGRGGAGNMRKSSRRISHGFFLLVFTNCGIGRPSSIREAWFKITSQPDQHPLVLTSSPEDHYASSKNERRTSSLGRRRSTVSSTWSSSTVGEHRSMWKRLFMRRSSLQEDDKRRTPLEVDGKEKISLEEDVKIEDSSS
jgi:hypothetical protein